MRRFGRQCRGQGKVFVTLVRQTETQLLTTGSPVVPLARTAQAQVQSTTHLTEAQRVGQLFLVGVTDDIAGPQTTAALQQYHFGSLLLYPTSEGVTALAAATAHMQALGTANDGVPKNRTRSGITSPPGGGDGAAAAAAAGARSPARDR